jgi:hypothetical protein
MVSREQKREFYLGLTGSTTIEREKNNSRRSDPLTERGIVLCVLVSWIQRARAHTHGARSKVE